MLTPPGILSKIKLLLKLSNSPNPNEAETARLTAAKLIEKYNVSDLELEEIKDKKPLYGDDDKVFHTIGLQSWKSRLILSIGNHFECQIVQEELVPFDGAHEFNYYVYGDPESAENVKIIWTAFSNKVEELILTKCHGRGNIYISSYCEGVAEAIASNLQWEDFDLSKFKKPTKLSEVAQSASKKDAITTTPVPKERPAEASVDVNSQSLIKDVMAYFKGLEDGRDLSLSNIVLLSYQNPIEELTQGDDSIDADNYKW